jgi:hypothetical protein
MGAWGAGPRDPGTSGGLIKINAARRHLNMAQRSELALILLEIEKAKPRASS